MEGNLRGADSSTNGRDELLRFLQKERSGQSWRSKGNHEKFSFLWVKYLSASRKDHSKEGEGWEVMMQEWQVILEQYL